MNVEPNDVLELTDAECHHGESYSDVDDDPANDYNYTDNEDEIKDINPKCNAVIRQIDE